MYSLINSSILNAHIHCYHHRTHPAAPKSTSHSPQESASLPGRATTALPSVCKA